jgi:hypothetical protein
VFHLKLSAGEINLQKRKNVFLKNHLKADI